MIAAVADVVPSLPITVCTTGPPMKELVFFPIPHNVAESRWQSPLASSIFLCGPGEDDAWGPGASRRDGGRESLTRRDRTTERAIRCT